MSPGRGGEDLSAIMQSYPSQKSMENHDRDYGSAHASAVFATNGSYTIEPTKSTTANHDKETSQGDNDATHSWAAPTEDRELQKQATSSVRSTSSSGNSRRDSAISASSQHRHRPKTSRTISKQSLQSDGETLKKSPSGSSRQRPRTHRMNTTGSLHTVPAYNVEDARALHARSREIFSTASRPSTSYAAATTTTSTLSSSRSYRTVHRSPSFQTPLPATHYPVLRPSASRSQTEPVVARSTEELQQGYDNYVPATVIHWTSDDVRRQQYAQIDKSNTGVRGLLKKVLPKWATKAQPKFYEGKDDESDAGSVRRIRIDLPSDVSSHKTAGRSSRSHAV